MMSNETKRDVLVNAVDALADDMQNLNESVLLIERYNTGEISWNDDTEKFEEI